VIRQNPQTVGTNKPNAHLRQVHPPDCGRFAITLTARSAKPIRNSVAADSVVAKTGAPGFFFFFFFFSQREPTAALVDTWRRDALRTRFRLALRFLPPPLRHAQMNSQCFRAQLRKMQRRKCFRQSPIPLFDDDTLPILCNNNNTIYTVYINRQFEFPKYFRQSQNCQFSARFACFELSAGSLASCFCGAACVTVQTFLRHVCQLR
jgi:hypothetical protein